MSNTNVNTIPSTPKIKVGIIGGSGIDNPQILEESYDIEASTAYGSPSSPLKCGKIDGMPVVLLARHGRAHTITPTYVNNRANIQSLLEAGCTHILATTACGSLRRDIGRGHLVILDQFIDNTKQRKTSFYERFEHGEIVHTAMARPFSSQLRDILIKSCEELHLPYHPQGTVITIEGPRFSTIAESKMFSRWGADVINMSTAPEAALANEAGIPYAAIAMSTDFDCLFEDIEAVSWEEVLKVFGENVGKVTSLLRCAIPKIVSLTPYLASYPIPPRDVKQRNNSPAKPKTPADLSPSSASLHTPQTATTASPFFDLAQTIRTIPNWPKPGIMFRDITTLIKNPIAFTEVIERFAGHYSSIKPDKIAGIESRGFIFGSALAHCLGLPFIPIRKQGKLPASTVSEQYTLEYGTDTLEIHRDAVSAGERVIIIDDLLATGGTAYAACRLIEQLSGKVAGLGFVIELPELNGRRKLLSYPIFNLIEFSGH